MAGGNGGDRDGDHSHRAPGEGRPTGNARRYRASEVVGFKACTIALFIARILHRRTISPIAHQISLIVRQIQRLCSAIKQNMRDARTYRASDSSDCQIDTKALLRH